MYEELVKRLREWPRVCIQYDGSVDQLHDDAADAIETLIPFKQQVENGMRLLDKAEELLNALKPRWIPVEERLPDENGFYLCLYELKQKCGIRMEENLGILQFIDNKWSIFDIYVVTHWLPIPEPPKEE